MFFSRFSNKLLQPLVAFNEFYPLIRRVKLFQTFPYVYKQSFVVDPPKKWHVSTENFFRYSAHRSGTFG